MVDQLNRISPAPLSGPRQDAFDVSLYADLWKHEFHALNRHGIATAIIPLADEFVLDIGRDALRGELKALNALRPDAENTQLNNAEKCAVASWRLSSSLLQTIQTWKWRRRTRGDLRMFRRLESLKPRSISMADWVSGLGGNLSK